MPPYNQAKALLSPRARHRWVWLASLLLIACGDGGGELDPPADAGLAGDVSLDVSLDSFADGGLDTSGEDDIAAADDAAAQDVAVAKPDSADDVAKPDASASPDGGPATDVGGMDGGGAGTQDAAQADGAETDAAQGQADGAEQADGGGADGGGADSGGADGAKPAVHIENQGGKLACSFDKYSPPAQAKVTWRWRLNTGAWADGKAVWDKQLKACDLLACTATVETTSAKLTSAPAKTQLPVGALCNTGNSCQAPSCSELGGCAAAGKPGTCEDGDPCTIGDTCTSGTCIAGKKEACVNYYSDQDGDGFGQASLGCLCKAPANAVTQKGDCNDTIKTVYPKAKETCDGLDEDCDGSTDEAACTGMFPPGTADFKPKKPTTGDTYDTEATATFDAGPFGKVTLTGNVKKTAKDKPATWCFAGPAKLSGAPFSLDKVQLKICKDAAGTITRTYAADLTIEGSKSSVSGTFSVGASAGLVMNATALKIMGLSASGVSLSWQKGQGHVSIAKADVTIAYLGQQLKGALTGKWVPNKDTTLAIAFATQTGSKTVGGVVGATSQTLSGSHSRKGGETTTTLALGAKKLTLPGANPDEWAVSAKRQSGKTWKLEIAAKDTTVGPFTNLALSGDFIEGAKTACVTGDTGHKPAGALTNMTVTVCWTDGKATVTYNAQVDAKPTGAAKLSGQWGSGKLCLSADVANAGPASGGAAPKVSVQTCFDPKTKVFSPLTFQTTAVLPNKAAVPMQGVTDPKTGALCLTGAATTQAGSLLPLKGVTFLAVTAKSCMAGQKFSDISINYIYRIGKSATLRR
ncbi:MAG: putative metal-binding motif-containing protein [Myxococcales bacterium]|nr:putative metal-binding motif-containing protein [Myxococcales bacterium]